MQKINDPELPNSSHPFDLTLGFISNQSAQIGGRIHFPGHHDTKPDHFNKCLHFSDREGRDREGKRGGRSGYSQREIKIQGGVDVQHLNGFEWISIEFEWISIKSKLI